MTTWSPTSLFNRRTYGSENLRPIPQKEFCNTTVRTTDTQVGHRAMKSARSGNRRLLRLAHGSSALRSFCASAISENSGVGEKPLSADASKACASTARLVEL